MERVLATAGASGIGLGNAYLRPGRGPPVPPLTCPWSGCVVEAAAPEPPARRPPGQPVSAPAEAAPGR
jgi:hypothetical protein